MPTTSPIDCAQVVLWGFWFFFFGLVDWLRMEDRREGYPLETDIPRKVLGVNRLMIPSPKTFLLPHGGTYQAPSFERDTRDIQAERTARSAGSTLQPTGDAMTANVGPASFAQRHDEPELTHEGHDAVVPMRVAKDFSVNAGPDPRGWDVITTDRKVAGKVKEIWIDRADYQARYLEVELADAGGTRLLPIPMMRLQRDRRQVEVSSIRAEHFPRVPALKQPDRVTVLEEDQISAFFAGGRLYAEPSRLGPIV
jgi:photosynthetic reaction center H subunit